VVGVPSSAAAHWPGLEKAPAALRAAGIVDVLRSAGLTVADDGDLPAVVWRSHRRPGSPNDVARVVDVVAAARDRLRPILQAGRVPLVLGGECTVTMALLSAAVERHGDVGLVYVDGGQDLMTVADHPEEPILDAMGVAHMLDLPGVSRALSGVGPRRPLLDPRHLVFFGFSDAEEDEHGQVPAVRIGAAEVMASPEAAAGRALDSVAGGPFILHVDADVLDFLALPAADVPSYGRGLTPEALERALRVLIAHSKLAGMTFVEFNPDHGGEPVATALVQLLSRAMAPVREA
jgi:arginase